MARDIKKKSETGIYHVMLIGTNRQLSRLTGVSFGVIQKYNDENDQKNRPRGSNFRSILADLK